MIYVSQAQRLAGEGPTGAAEGVVTAPRMPSPVTAQHSSYHRCPACDNIVVVELETGNVMSIEMDGSRVVTAPVQAAGGSAVQMRVEPAGGEPAEHVDKKSKK